MSTVNYKIRSFDKDSKVLIVDFQDEGWATMTLTAPFPETKAELDAVVSRYARTKEQIEASEQIADLGFVSDLVGIDTSGERLSLTSIEPFTNPDGKYPSSLTFISQFTDEEQLAIVQATLASPAVKLWYDKMLAADNVVFDDPRLLGGMQALIDNGLLTAERRDEIILAITV